MGKVISINTGKCVDLTFSAKRGQSAIKKLPRSDGVWVNKLGLDGDEQAADFHGGILQAVYAYAREDLDWWSRELGRSLRNGMFGENLTLAGFDVSGSVLAEQWQVGEAILEVTAPRMACGTFGGWMEEKGWAKRFNGIGRPGAYLRVLREGRIRTGDPVEVLWRPKKRVTVSESVRAILGDLDVLQRIVAVTEQVPSWDEGAMMFHVQRRAKSEMKRKAMAAQASAEKEADAQPVR